MPNLDPVNIRLENTQGTSSKAYEIYMFPEGGGWRVNYANGKIGGTLQNGTKTPNGPVSREEADALVAALLKDKTKGGYEIKKGATVTAPVGSTDKVDTGLRVQLLNEIPHLPRQPNESDLDRLIRSAAGYIFSAEWIGQQKHNGHRVPLIWDGGELVGSNRNGEERPIPAEVAGPLAALYKQGNITKRTELDGELVGSVWYGFDLTMYNGQDWRDRQFEDRARQAQYLLAGIHKSYTSVVWSEIATTPTQKVRMLQDLYATYQKDGRTFCGAEGMVFKKRQSKYTAGRPGSGGNQMKLKFWRDVDFVVMAGKAGKRSVVMGLYVDGVLIPHGNITIPANYDIPKAGQVATARYLTILANGKFVQPQFEGVRTDKRQEECTDRQLIYWPGIDGEGE